MTSAEAAAVDESFHDLPLELAVQARAQVHEQSDTPLAEPWTLATWPHVPTESSPRLQRPAPRNGCRVVLDEMDDGHLSP